MPTINKKTNYTSQPKYKHEAKANSLKYYNSIGWRRLRSALMSTHPLCVECAAKGISRPATDLHHKIPYLWWNTEEDRYKALLYVDWIVPLCQDCHYKIHNTLNRPKDFESTKEYKIIHDIQ